MIEQQGVWVAGEALVDLLPDGKERRAVVGGGPANTAKALANLGLQTSLIAGLSSDKYGDLIEQDLIGVDLSLALRSNLPTALAIVTLDSKGSASYDFRLHRTATFDFRKEWLPPGTPVALHIGTLAAIVHPGADELFNWAKRLEVPIIYDPNIRPSFLPELASYREAVEKWASISTVIKLSEDDLSFLGYKDVSKFFSLGVSLVVVTSGESGLSGITPNGRVSVPGVKVEVIDTVGAGDTVGAILVEGFVRYGLETLVGEKLSEVLSRAAKAAAITCTRAGAKPPTLSELGA